MKQYQEIEILLERFMEGRTSLGEEARLSEFFRQTPDLPSEWEPYREMFAYFDSGMPDVEAATPRPVPVWYRRRKVVTWLAAACLAVCMVSMWWWVSRPEASEAPMLSLVEPAAGAPDSVKAKKAAPRPWPPSRRRRPLTSTATRSRRRWRRFREFPFNRRMTGVGCTLHPRF